MRDGGKPLVKKARRRKLAREARSKDEEEEDDQWERLLGFLGRRIKELRER